MSDLTQAVSKTTRNMVITYLVLLVGLTIGLGIAGGGIGLISAAITGGVCLLLLLTSIFAMRFVAKNIDYAQAVLMGAFALKLAIAFVSAFLVFRMRAVLYGRVILVSLIVYIVVIAVAEAVSLGKSRVPTVDKS